MSSSSKERELKLKSSDNEEFRVKESIAVQSEMIKNMVEDDCAANTIPLPNVNSKTLAMVIEYWKKHANQKASEDDLNLNKFDSEFVKKDKTVLFDLVSAANYLNIKGLMDVVCQKIAEEITDMQPEQIREIFNIVNDYIPEEEEEVRKESAWAFED
ncbi:hypothetical protein F0562_031943 [Nyssa sinensis]|uniref:SKP1-like protein n=1 Tax=Nyssa sinensis TaxID=561372 RepID=A0A5J5AX77_9ASTE|nr:hypothetical protein F0562_031943 [Nyssa sinensis]